MAQNFSLHQIQKAQKFYYGKFYFIDQKLSFINKIVNKILILSKFFKLDLINFKRLFVRNLINLFKKKNDTSIKITLGINDLYLKKYSSDLKKNEYVFIENFLNKEFHKNLNDSWPDINFFTHNKKITKHYSVGFKSLKKNFLQKDIKYFQTHNHLYNFYKFVISNEFNEIVNSKIFEFEQSKYYNYSIISTMVGNNSYLIPHIDGIEKYEKSAYNFLYFVDGNENNTYFSGATGIFEDNNFQKPLFIPKTLKNSLLIYKSTNRYYHGFEFTKLPKKIFRKSINFQFLLS